MNEQEQGLFEGKPSATYLLHFIPVALFTESAAPCAFSFICCPAYSQENPLTFNIKCVYIIKPIRNFSKYSFEFNYCKT